MTEIDLGIEEQWSLSPFIGYEHPFFIINKATIIYTWILIVLLIVLCLIARLIMQKNNGIARFTLLSLTSNFMDLIQQALGVFSFKHFSFIAAIFCFIALGNTISVIPWMEEPTKDLNTTLALGIISFLYVQYTAIMRHGVIGYIKDYFSPFIVMFPLNLVGKISSIVSISFRLFGNIFGGSIITNMYFAAIKGSVLFETVAILSGVNIIITVFFSLFEGFLQAFVFAMLSLTYLSIAQQSDEHS